jgi:hypothetical protein
MRRLNGQIVAGDLPLRLTAHEVEHPEAVLSGFFGSYSPGEVRELLWDVVSRSLCVSDEEMGTFGRREILEGYEALERLVEAAHLIHRKGL